MRLITKIYTVIKHVYDKNKEWHFLSTPNNEFAIDDFQTSFNINRNICSNDSAKIFEKIKERSSNSRLFYYNGECYFEPEWLWGITKEGQLIEFSVPNNCCQWSQYESHPRPSHFDIQHRWSKRQYDKIIVFDDFYNFSKNYYHFMVKMLAQFFHMKRKGIDLSLPVLCPAKLREKKFFKEFAELFPALKKLNYIDYHNTIIKCNGFYISTGNTMFPEQLDLFRTITIPFNIVKKKVFVGRKNVARIAANSTEIEKIVESKGFETIYFENYSIAEQIAIIRTAERIVAYHGAGLTNLLFVQNQNLKVLEIHNANANLYYHYMLICNIKGLQYDCFVGGDLINDTYYVDPIEFERKFSQWLNGPSEEK